MLRVSATMALLAPALAVTPMEKVIKLLEDLKGDVEKEGKSEAATYEKFACFCKDNTKTKSSDIEDSQDKIDQCNADIGEKTATRQEKIADLGKEQKKVEDTTIKLAETTDTYQKDKAAYQATNADLTKAVNSAKRAHAALKDSNKAAAFLDLGALKSDVQSCLDLAMALGVVQDSSSKAVTSFLQVDPNDPAYKFHSEKILSIIQDLQNDFQDEKDKVNKEWAKTEKTYKAEKKDLEDKIQTAKDEIKKLNGEIDKLKSEIAKLKTDLINAEDSLKDDSAYLRDLTDRCEANAQSWDQRTKTRKGEVEALTKALEILNKKAKDADADVNKRALLMHVKKPEAPVAKAPAVKPAPAAPVAKESKPAAPVKALAKPIKATAVAEKKPTASSPKAVPTKKVVPAKKVVSFLQAGSESSRTADAVAILRDQGARLNSNVLSALAEQIAKDPFKKIKKLIQGLIERLLEESKAEATKKGFCDTELGQAEKTRKNRFSDVRRLGSDIGELQAHKSKLEEELVELGLSLKDLNDELDKATKLRGEEKDENEKTIKTATGGAKAVAEALAVLQDFYKSAAKETVLLQASPVDEDTDGTGFNKAYKGDQSSSKAILGLLETIKTDFERTVRKTEAAEAKAHAEFVQFDRTSKSDIAAKETKTDLNKQDLGTTKSAIKQGFKDLQTAQDLLDGALKNIEDLKPTCIDTGMSYAERVKKREEEIKALGNALCALDEENKEPDCQK